jgi:hypothetical protein
MKPGNPRILTINGGSSSIKFAMFEAGDALRQILEGGMERIGLPGTTDGELGHVDDFIIDDQLWAIRYLVIDTKNWWPGKKVLVSPHWIESVNWDQSKVFVNLLREAIKQSPEYTEESLLTRDYETALHQHYNRQGYWVAAPAAKAKKRSR